MQASYNRQAANEDFRCKLTVGQQGESLISVWLRSQNFTVIPAYDKEIGSGKGPQVFTPHHAIIAPDLLTVKKKRLHWFEAKSKSVFTWHRNSQQWTTGIDLRHYKEYIEVAKTMEVPVWLLFLHKTSQPDARDISYGCPTHCPTGLFGNSLGYLQKHESHRHSNWGVSGMVYWSHRDLRLLANILPDGSIGPKIQCSKM